MTTAAVDLYPLWAKDRPFPRVDEIEWFEGAESHGVHRADGDYAFLHDCAIAKLGGTLFAAWYNCPKEEMQEASVIRGRRSVDGGRSWSDVEVISSDPSGTYLHVPVSLYAEKDRLYAWVLRMTAPDVPADLLLHTFSEDGGWRLEGPVAERFLPNAPPARLADGGGYAMAGRTAIRPGERALHPAIAFRRDPDLTGRWTVTALGDPDTPIGCPETALVADRDELVAIVRPGEWEKGDPERQALVATSPDGGASWSALRRSNFPMHPSKPFAGLLSTGQRYLVSNTPGRGGNGRELLTLAVSRPGEQTFSRLWKLRDGPCAQLGCGPEWSYPFAVEDGGNLYVMYTSEKRHGVLTTVPIESLRNA